MIPFRPLNGPPSVIGKIQSRRCFFSRWTCSPVRKHRKEKHLDRLSSAIGQWQIADGNSQKPISDGVRLPRMIMKQRCNQLTKQWFWLMWFFHAFILRAGSVGHTFSKSFGSMT